MYYDGTNFYGIGLGANSRPQTYKYTNLTSITDLFWFTYAWYDSAGTTHETEVVLNNFSYAWVRRAGFTATIADLPGGGGADDPDSARVYQGAHPSTLPAASAFDLQATGAGPTISWETYNSSGGAPNGGTPFPAATRATIENSEGTLIINGPDYDIRADTALFEGAVEAQQSLIVGTELDVGEQLFLPLVADFGATSGNGDARWNGTSRGLEIGDGTQARPVTPIGYQPYAFPIGSVDFATANSTAVNLATVASGDGGAILIPIVIHAAMQVEECWFYSTDTSLARSAEWRLYYDQVNSGANLFHVAGLNGTMSFTPGSATWRSSAASTPAIIAPGSYWLVIRNTSTARSFGIGVAAGGISGAPTITRVDTALGALDTSLDFSGFSANNNRVVQAALMGSVFGEGAPWA
jgi:hypothetical protein